MGAYCTRAFIPRHAARADEIMQVRRLSSYWPDVALFGDRNEIACIPHTGCRLEIVAIAETSHPVVDLLLPGHVIRYRRSFFFGDRFELPSGATVSLEQLIGFKLQLAPPMATPLPVEEAVVEQVTRRERSVTVG